MRIAMLEGYGMAKHRRKGGSSKLARAAKHCKGTKGKMKFRKCIRSYFKRH